MFSLKVGQITCSVLAVAFVLGLSSIYGKRSNDFAAYMGGPGICIFACIILTNRRELIREE
eukprot:CAMPEP_0195120532 /NCGR_PEP_ID=MMETSP0448-20130528/122058_1 /TAXON_ID=66468 /ORGANISM="Heterocapsa triquestra, Strain CCMP 448" /LENGTH=60 /DNA_ID=CAMNT_0040157959 /DNA_START=76 /DNA_END=255 /DNA_ORIENTATION=+